MLNPSGCDAFLVGQSPARTVESNVGSAQLTEYCDTHMCAGMLEPSAGDAFLAGHSVAREAGAVQHARVGLCPQRNVLFGSLTVAEHLTLYAAVRGMSGCSFLTAVQGAWAGKIPEESGPP